MERRRQEGGYGIEMKYLGIYWKDYKRDSVLAPLFKMLEAGFDLLVPIVVARIINVGIAEQDKGYILGCCGLLVLMAVVGTCCSFTAQYFAARAAIGSAAGLRHMLFAHIQKLGFSEIDTIGSSTLITRMTSDINQVQNGLNLFLRLFLRSPFIVFGAMVMAFTIDWELALILVVAIPLLSVIVFGIMRITSPLYKKVQARLDKVTKGARENLSGVRVIRAFGREEEEIRDFSRANAGLVDMQLFVGRISALMNPLTYTVVNLGIIGILYAGSRTVNGGTLMSGDIIALVNYMSQILVELVKLANLIVSISRALASLSRVEQVLDTKTTMEFPEASKTAGDERELRQTEVAVRFEQVGLTYPQSGEESLSDISFTVKRGQTVGIIGGTGSGKSSLVHLIPRFYDATRGQVSLLGRPVQTWDKENLRKHVAVVMQKVQLFAGTIRSNLLWGNEEASEEDMWEALEMAQARDFVEGRPQGLDEPVEQGGRNFSGGQRQRLTIARALIRKPEILILDDSSSALDYATDAALRKALSALSPRTTVFYVSQRTASIQHADVILVLDDGRIVGKGRHEELLKSCETYREIYDSQFQKGGRDR